MDQLSQERVICAHISDEMNRIIVILAFPIAHPHCPLAAKKGTGEFRNLGVEEIGNRVMARYKSGVDCKGDKRGEKR